MGRTRGTPGHLSLSTLRAPAEAEGISMIAYMSVLVMVVVVVVLVLVVMVVAEGDIHDCLCLY